MTTTASPTFEFSGDTWYVYSISTDRYQVGEEISHPFAPQKFIVGEPIILPPRNHRLLYGAKWPLTPVKEKAK